MVSVSWRFILLVRARLTFIPVKLACAMVWLLYLVDQLGRRPLLMIGSAGGALCMYYIAGYIAIAQPSGSSGSVDAGGRSAVAAFYLWTLFYSPTWNGTPWVIGAEMFPQHVRTFTQSTMAASNWLFTFLIARFTPQMFTAMGYGVYLFFASLMTISVFFIFVGAPSLQLVLSPDCPASSYSPKRNKYPSK